MTSPSDLTWESIPVRLGDLVEWDRNPRKMTAAQAESLRTSINKFGFVEPVVVDHDGVSLIGGHMRTRVMLQRLLMNHDTIIDARRPSRPLAPKEFEELNIRLNQNQGEWDFDALANEFDAQELIDWGFQPTDFGMDDSAKGGGEEPDPDVCPKCKRPL